MLNTLFGRNWNTVIPNLDEYQEKTMLSDGAESFYVQKDFVKAFTKWSSPFGADIADLTHILNSLEIKGWITYIGNFDETDKSFVIFTSSGCYFARLDHGNSFNNACIRIAEELHNGTIEKNFSISRPKTSGMVKVIIDACKIKNAYGMIRADYTHDSKNACGSLRIRREHVDYDVEILCKKKNVQARIIESGAMRSKMEMFFLTVGLEGAYELYQTFVQEIFEDGILPEDIEIMKIKTYRDAQFVSEVCIEKSDLKMLCFFDHDELWRFKSDGSWDYVQGDETISWKWREKQLDFELVSNFDNPLNSDKCTEQTLEYAYVVNKALAYRNMYFGF